jgi:hypothetical protein
MNEARFSEDLRTLKQLAGANTPTDVLGFKSGRTPLLSMARRNASALP